MGRVAKTGGHVSSLSTECRTKYPSSKMGGNKRKCQEKIWRAQRLFHWEKEGIMGGGVPGSKHGKGSQEGERKGQEIILISGVL